MHCPHCGNGSVWRAESHVSHYLRMVIGSDKRYCPSCKSKWRARQRSAKFSPNTFFLLIAASILGYFAVTKASELISSNPSSLSTSMQGSQQTKVAEYKKKLKQDPSMLSSLSPEQIAALKQAYKNKKM
jgi:hypothetical protein